VGLGLAHRLLQVRLEALALDRPRPDQRLVQQVLGVAVGPRVTPVPLEQTRPACERRPPAFGDLAEQADPQPGVLASLGVVRRRREHRARPVGQAGRVRCVERVQAGPEDARVTADLVERDEPEVAVERRVLDALGHHRAGQLLEPHHPFVLALAPDAQPEQVRDEPEEALLDVGSPGDRVADGEVDRVLIVLRDPACLGADVCPVDGERGGQLANHLVTVVPGVVPIPAVRLADLEQQGSQPVQLAAEALAQDLELGLPGDRRDVGRHARELAVDPGHRGLGARIHEQSADQVEEVVAGRAVDRPVGRERLAWLEDLLDHDPAPGRRGTQPAEVFGRVAQAVGVVHPQPVEHAPVEPVEHERVGVLEDGLVLHA
jgi:hypothetical protein